MNKKHAAWLNPVPAPNRVNSFSEKFLRLSGSILPNPTKWSNTHKGLSKPRATTDTKS